MNDMKKITCYDCENVFESETSKDILNQLYAHYMKDHPKIITNATDDEKKAWMEQFNKDWKAAEEI